MRIWGIRLRSSAHLILNTRDAYDRGGIEKRERWCTIDKDQIICETPEMICAILVVHVQSHAMYYSIANLQMQTLLRHRARK